MEILGLQKLHKNDGIDVIDDDLLGKIKLCDCTPKSLINDVFEAYVKKGIHPFNERDFEDCTTWTWTALKHSNGIFDPRRREIVDVEKYFDFEIKEPWAKYHYEIGEDILDGYLSLKGTIDLITKINDTTYEIIDWKTGQRKDWATDKIKEFKDFKDDPQLRMYFYAAKQLYPHIKQFIVTIFYIRDGGPYSICFDDSDLEKTERMLCKKFTRIKNTVRPKLSISWKCTKFCHFGKNKWRDTDKTICQHFREENIKKGTVDVIKEYKKGKHGEYGAGGGRSAK